MGKLEQESQKRGRRANLQKIILQSIVIAGIITVGLLSTNALGAMVKMGIFPKRRQKEFIKNSRDRLVQKGFLVYKDKQLSLTEKGKVLLVKLELLDFRLKKPKRWDKKWRVLIFDISEKRKVLREKVRRTLMAIGFVRLQDSVWIYPYDCEDLVTLLKTDFKVGKDLLYMIVDSLEYDNSLREHFNLVS